HSCKAEIREHCERLIERLAGRSPFHLNARLLTDPFVGMRGAALGFPRQRQWRHGECRGSSDVSAPQLADLDFRDARDETQMIIRAAPRRARCSPHTDRTVFVRFRVGVLVEPAAQEALESLS